MTLRDDCRLQREKGAAKQATTCREDQERLRSYQSGGALGHLMYTSRGNLAKLNYLDIKQLLDRKAIEYKRGTLTNGEMKPLVKEIHHRQTEGEFQQGIAETEM
jgi:hypothetical protein